MGWGEGRVALRVWAGVGVVLCGAEPWLSALGWAESRTPAVAYPRCPPAQLYILKHHRGAHMPELCGG